MFNLYLKKLAKERLRGIYRGAFFGQLVCCIPAYLISLLLTLLATKTNNVLTILLISLLGEIFIIDIFTVGYVRSLMRADEMPEGTEKRYDINNVLSGFSENYLGTLKTMFTRRLYLFGWGMLMFLPMIIAVGVIAFLSYRPEISQLMNYVMQIAQSPTDDMLFNMGSYIAQNCLYVVYIFGGASVLSLILTIPYVRKSYLYEMIPMILAESPETTTADAFRKTKEIMHGHRFSYFVLELSFIGIILLTSLLAYIIPGAMGMYIAMAILMPYMMMTFIQFYFARTRVKTEETDKLMTQEDSNGENE